MERWSVARERTQGDRIGKRAEEPEAMALRNDM